MAGRGWREEEKDVVRSLYPCMKAEEIAEVLGRTKYAVQLMARKLNVNGHPKREARWTKQAIDVLKELYPASSKEEILKALSKRSWKAIRAEVKRLKIRRVKKTCPKRRKGYQLIEVLEEILIKLYEKKVSLRAIAHELGVCHHTIRSRLKGLGLPIPNRLESLARRPTRPEIRFIGICKENNLPFKYVGNGAFWIGNINPDFIESNGRKEAVEIFSDYWHSPLFNRNIRRDMLYETRREILRSRGWNCIIFWESEVMCDRGEDIVLKRLKN